MTEIKHQGFTGNHPSLPCERCFRLPPGPSETVNGKKRLGTAPYCRCLPDETWEKIHDIIAEQRLHAEVPKIWKYPHPGGQVAA
jgi:hypothetical protein